MSRQKNKPLKKSFILDPVHPTDLLSRNMIYCCEQCSYYNNESQSCAFGYNTKMHNKKNQDKLYALSGKMAICRFCEID